MEKQNRHIDFEELTHKVLIGKATDEEIASLKNWLTENEEHQKQFSEQRDIWSIIHAASRYKQYDEQLGWNKLKQNILVEKRVQQTIKPTGFFNFKNSYKIAALFLLAFTTGILVTYWGKSLIKTNQQEQFTVHNVPYGSKSQLTLADGSKVWLNSGSTLKYSSKFNESIREVYLEGEGYFDISKNPQKPFLVKTTGVTVKVLGTAFNIKAYPEERTIETTVTRGLVKVLNTNNETTETQEVLLHANQKAIYDKDEANVRDKTSKVATIDNKSKESAISTKSILSIKDEVNVTATISWKDHRWIIEHEDLQSLAVKIERRYNVQVIFANEDLKKYIFSGAIEEESLEQVLNMIKLTAPINYIVNQNLVTLIQARN